MGLLRGALAGAGRRPARRPQGRRRLRPARPRLSARSGWPSCWTTRGVPVLLTQEPLRGRAARAPAPRSLCLDADGRSSRARARSRRLPRARRRTTSPTSSTPPAPPAGPRASLVAAPRPGATSRWPQAASSRRCGPDSRVLQSPPLSFDASVCELFCRSLAGARAGAGAARAAAAGRASWPRCCAAQAHHRRAPCRPSALAQLVPERAARRCATRHARGGEALPAELARALGAPGRRCVNAYGPTEATVCATAARGARRPRPAPPIGRPIANTQRLRAGRRACSRCPSACPASCYIGGAAWPAATSAGRT